MGKIKVLEREGVALSLLEALGGLLSKRSGHDVHRGPQTKQPGFTERTCPSDWYANLSNVKYVVVRELGLWYMDG